MNILFISEKGEGIGLAYRMGYEGHKVKLFVRQPEYEFTGLGLVERVESWRPELARVDFVICDSSGMGFYQNVFKDVKVPVLGSNSIADIINGDPAKVVELCEKAGIICPKTWTLRDPSDGSSLISDFPKSGLIIKATDSNKVSQTVLCRDPQTYYWALTKFDSSYSIVVQEYIIGTKLAVEGWFNGTSWITPYLLTFSDYSDISEDGFSSITGTTVIKKTKPNNIIRDSVMKFTPLLKKISYKGPISINCVVVGKKVYAVSINPKMTYDSIEAISEGLQSNLTDFLYKVATTGIDEMPVTTDHLISVRLGTPYNPAKIDMPIVGLVPENLKHIFLHNVYKWECGAGEERNPSKDEIRYIGPGSLVAKVTARGRDIGEARNRVYRTIDNLSFLDKRFDPNVGANVEKSLSYLGQQGHI